MTPEEVFSLLETRDIPGTDAELRLFCIRMDELRKMNGERWIRHNREKLLKEWAQTLCYLKAIHK